MDVQRRKMLSTVWTGVVRDEEICRSFTGEGAFEMASEDDRAEPCTPGRASIGKCPEGSNTSSLARMRSEIEH